MAHHTGKGRPLFVAGDEPITAPTSGAPADELAHLCDHPADASQTTMQGCPRWPQCLGARPVLDASSTPLTASDVAEFAERWRGAVLMNLDLTRPRSHRRPRRNPLRKRWALVVRVPGVGLSDVRGTFWLRGSAEVLKDRLEGRHGGVGQAYAPGILHIERLP